MIGSVDLKTSKKSRLGSYICKIGYFDIRQKVTLPSKRDPQGSVKVYIYHRNHQMAGPFKSHHTAKIQAEELMSEGKRYVKYQEGR